MALGIVYYMRLNTKFREAYKDLMDKQNIVLNEVTFSQAFNDELNWYIDQVELPQGIAKTQALKENIFATIICTVTRIPLIIVGAPVLTDPVLQHYCCQSEGSGVQKGIIPTHRQVSLS